EARGTDHFRSMVGFSFTSPQRGEVGEVRGTEPGEGELACKLVVGPPHPTSLRSVDLSPLGRGEAKILSRARLSGAEDAIFKRGELLDADRPARMQAAGGNADFGTEAELAAVGELG